MIKIEVAENGWIITNSVGIQSVYNDPEEFISRVMDLTMDLELRSTIAAVRVIDRKLDIINPNE